MDHDKQDRPASSEAGRGGCAALRELLSRALGEQGLAQRLDRRLPTQLWNDAVGPEIARRAQPTVLAAGVLHVLVQDRNWRDQLDAMRMMLIARLNQRLGRPLIKELRFGMAHEGALEAGSRRHGGARSQATPLSHAQEAVLRDRDCPERLLPEADLLPPGVREAVLRAAAAHKARQERAA
jgi:predicted nucleic acid-binding Zn ribbon protein